MGMCGICGLVGEDAGPGAAAERGKDGGASRWGGTGGWGTANPAAETLRRMSARLRHRGPDEEGSYLEPGVALASRRLSILDVGNAHQPLVNETGEVIAVFNGEIYNYQELRRDLIARGHHFRSAGDGEVIVHLYEEHGESLPRFLEGMFALAIWDRRRQALVLARDRFGVKPLYYAARAGGFSFASELGALTEDPGWETTWDWTALDLYLELNYIPAPYSAFVGARKLPAGHALRWRPGELKLFRYWLLPERLAARAEAASAAGPASPARRIEALGEELLARLRVAVRRRLISDVPLGLFLSGGLDSATTLALMAEATAQPVRTFSVGFAEKSFSELPAARRLARRFGAEHHELMLRPKAIAALPEIASHFDEPFGDSSALPTYFVSRLARQHVKVCLGGDGGDELLAGYQTYAALRLARWYDRLPRRWRSPRLGHWAELLPPRPGKLPWSYRLQKFQQGLAWPAGQRQVGWRAVFTPEQRQRLWRRGVWPGARAALLAGIAGEWESGPDSGSDWLNPALYVDLRLYLADDILVKLDRMTMAHSLEGREPWLDSELALFCFTLPGGAKLRGLRGKYLLRRATRGLLPGAIRHGGKKGFSIPLGAWLRGPLRPAAEAALLGSSRLSDYLDRDFVAMILRRHLRGEADYGRQVWNLMVLAEWMAAAARRPSRSRDSAVSSAA